MVAYCSREICSSNRECITIALAPASSRRRTMSRSSTIGEAPGMNGWGSVRPRYCVLRLMRLSVLFPVSVARASSDHSSQPLVHRVSSGDVLGGGFHHSPEPLGVLLLDHAEPSFVL